MPEEIEPAMWARPDLRAVLIGHDMGALYRALNEIGISQRRIAVLTGTTQSQVADILAGRRTRVMAYEVLVRNAKGLSIPPERMGLSWWGPDGQYYGPAETYPGGVKVANTPGGVSSAMLRRHVIALGGLIMAGVPITRAAESKVGEFLDDLGELPALSLPSRLSNAHVARVRDMTRRLGVGDIGCADPQMAAAVAAVATRYLDVPGPDPVQRALLVAVAELRLEAGWAAFDAGLHRPALYHYSRALELATEAGDAYCQALALGEAGLASVEHDHPDDGLKMLQAARIAAWNIPPDDQRAIVVGEIGRPAVEAVILADAASALAQLGHPVEATQLIARGRDLWTPTAADPFGDVDRPAAALELQRGRLDIAEQFAAASLHRWLGGTLKSRTLTAVVRATIHVRAAEPRGLQLAHSAITDVTTLTSVRARRQLVPLAEALESRPGSDARELARMARQVAA